MSGDGSETIDGNFGAEVVDLGVEREARKVRRLIEYLDDLGVPMYRTGSRLESKSGLSTPEAWKEVTETLVHYFKEYTERKDDFDARIHSAVSQLVSHIRQSGSEQPRVKIKGESVDRNTFNHLVSLAEALRNKIIEDFDLSKKVDKKNIGGGRSKPTNLITFSPKKPGEPKDSA